MFLLLLSERRVGKVELVPWRFTRAMHLTHHCTADVLPSNFSSLIFSLQSGVWSWNEVVVVHSLSRLLVHHPCLLVFFYLHLFFPGEPQFPRPFPEGVPNEGSVFLLLVPLWNWMVFPDEA